MMTYDTSDAYRRSVEHAKQLAAEEAVLVARFRCQMIKAAVLLCAALIGSSMAALALYLMGLGW